MLRSTSGRNGSTDSACSTGRTRVASSTSRMEMSAALATDSRFSLSTSASSRFATSASVWMISRAAIRPPWMSERLISSCLFARASDSRLIAMARCARLTLRKAPITDSTVRATVSRYERRFLSSRIRAMRNGAVSTPGPNPRRSGVRTRVSRFRHALRCPPVFSPTRGGTLRRSARAGSARSRGPRCRRCGCRCASTRQCAPAGGSGLRPPRARACRSRAGAER